MFKSPWLTYSILLLLSFVVSAVLTGLIRRWAVRMDFLDHPGGHKSHETPMPLLGGAAIFFTFNGILCLYLLMLAFSSRIGAPWMQAHLERTFGDHGFIKLCGILLGGLVIFLLGLYDDRKALGAIPKLLGQMVAMGILIGSGIRFELFDMPFIVTVAATLFWGLLIINALNFMDNMDGLCGGVSIIAALSFFVALQPYEDHMVRTLLIIFAGAVGGFLIFNINPAKVFMGDAGAMFLGYFLATVAILGTFHIQGQNTPFTVAAPILALSVPIFDIVSVIYIRYRNKTSPMQADQSHFSHRLVALGMTPRQAVSFSLLVAAVVGMGGAILPQLNSLGTTIIVVQTIGVFILIGSLMRVGAKGRGGNG